VSRAARRPSVAAAADVRAAAEASLQVKKVLDEITAKFGTVNTVVQCAGIGVAGKVLSKKGPHDLSLFTKVSRGDQPDHTRSQPPRMSTPAAQCAV